MSDVAGEAVTIDCDIVLGDPPSTSTAPARVFGSMHGEPEQVSRAVLRLPTSPSPHLSMLPARLNSHSCPTSGIASRWRLRGADWLAQFK